MHGDGTRLFATLLIGALGLSGAACTDIISSGDITGEVLTTGATGTGGAGGTGGMGCDALGGAGGGDTGDTSCAFDQQIVIDLQPGTIQRWGTTHGDRKVIPPHECAAQGPGQVYKINFAENGTFTAKLEACGWDGNVYVQSECQKPMSVPISCGEDVSSPVSADTYFVIVAGKSPSASGNYRVTFTLSTADAGP